MKKIIEKTSNFKIYKIEKTDINKPKTFKYEPVDRFIFEYISENNNKRMFELFKETYDEFTLITKNRSVIEVELEEFLIEKENELIEMDLVSYKLISIK